MNKVDELKIAKITKLDGFGYKKTIFAILMILSILLISFLTWGYGFDGILYIKLKNKTQTIYQSTFVYRRKAFCNTDNFTNDGKKICLKVENDLDLLYSGEDSNKFIYTPIIKIDSLKSKNKNNMIFSITDISFKDEKTIEEKYKFMNTVFFKYNSNNKIFDILYRNIDLERLKG